MSKLSIPEDISLDHDYMPGIGQAELKRLLMTAVPGVLVTVIAWLTVREPIQQLVFMGCGAGYVAVCYGFFAKVDKQQSIYTYLAKIVRFWRSQKKYFYRQELEVIRLAEDEQE